MVQQYQSQNEVLLKKNDNLDKLKVESEAVFKVIESKNQELTNKNKQYEIQINESKEAVSSKGNFFQFSCNE